MIFLGFTIVQLGVFLGGFLLLVYLVFRQYKHYPIYMVDMIKSFALGFSIILPFKIAVIGFTNVCDEIGDLGNGCLLIGSFALFIFASHGFYTFLLNPEPEQG